MKRDDVIQFRVSARRKEHLKAMAKQRQIALSELVRDGLISIQFGDAERTIAVHKEIRALRFGVAELKAEIQASRTFSRHPSSDQRNASEQAAAISRQIVGIERKLDKLMREAGGHR
ncbi:hypothetical protein [Roseibium sp.]|uniref:hypothetical protein n=1 Tax=Roseibium sp. TaxID=1936156 RepID=UPI003A96AF60